jgi:hypothetical protein
MNMMYAHLILCLFVAAALAQQSLEPLTKFRMGIPACASNGWASDYLLPVRPNSSKNGRR